MTALHFVDSNILVYRHDRDEAEKQARAHALLKQLWQQRTGRVSAQVLHEFYVVATRKLATPIPRTLARAEVRQLSLWQPIPSSPALRDAAWDIEDRFGLSWWDALIVAAAQAAGCQTLLTEDLQDGLDLDGLQVRNPFLHDP